MISLITEHGADCRYLDNNTEDVLRDYLYNLPSLLCTYQYYAPLPPPWLYRGKVWHLTLIWHHNLPYPWEFYCSPYACTELWTLTNKSLLDSPCLVGERVGIWLTGMPNTWCIWLLHNSNPHLFPNITWEGVMGHNTDRCITIWETIIGIAIMILMYLFSFQYCS